MSILELFIIIGITMIVFPKHKWPMLAYHLMKLYQFIQRYQSKMMQVWQKLNSEYQFELNQKKVKK